MLVCRPCDSARTVHPLCFPIPIPDNDPFYPSRNASGHPLCLPVTRSTPGQLTLGKFQLSERCSKLCPDTHGPIILGKI